MLVPNPLVLVTLPAQTLTSSLNRPAFVETSAIVRWFQLFLVLSFPGFVTAPVQTQTDLVKVFLLVHLSDDFVPGT